MSLQLQSKWSKMNKDGLSFQKDKFMPIKVVLLGEYGVGKTCLLNYLLDDPTHMNSMTSKDYKSKHLHFQDKEGTISFWDPAGQQKYRNVPAFIYRDINACIFVYDVANPQTLKSIPFWHNDIFDKLYPTQPAKLVKILVAHKADLQNSCSGEQIKKVFDETGEMKVLEVSTKHREGGKEIMEYLIENLNFQIQIKKPEEQTNKLKRKDKNKKYDMMDCCQ